MSDVFWRIYKRIVRSIITYMYIRNQGQNDQHKAFNKQNRYEQITKQEIRRVEIYKTLANLSVKLGISGANLQIE